MEIFEFESGDGFGHICNLHPENFISSTPRLNALITFLTVEIEVLSKFVDLPQSVEQT